MARGIAPAVFPSDDADPQEIARIHVEVDRAAGRASDATSLTNCYIEVQGGGVVDPLDVALDHAT